MTYRYQDGGRAVRSYDDKGKKQIRYYGRQKRPEDGPVPR